MHDGDWRCSSRGQANHLDDLKAEIKSRFASEEKKRHNLVKELSSEVHIRMDHMREEVLRETDAR